jgi:quercetin dioxygenase-like cupin family protein
MKKTVSLTEGAVLVAKRMEGTEGTAFPAHSASLESALVMLEGSGTITFPNAVHELRAGDTFIVPADEVHQVVGTPGFTAVHVMPKDIRFNFKD